MLTHTAKNDLFAARTIFNPILKSLMHMPTFTVKTTHIPKQQKKAQTLNK